jgi:hypothetical protein
MISFESDLSNNFAPMLRLVMSPSGTIIRYPDRWLSFGWDPPIGTLTIISRERCPDLVEFESYARWTARFDVLVPAGFSSRLTISRDVTDAHRLARFASWPSHNHDELSMVDCKLGDPAIRHFAGLWGLRYLDLYGTWVTDESGPVLGGLTGLEWLSLTNTRIGTRGIERLGAMPNLRRLSLRGTPITDNALVTLAEMPHLEWLSVADTGVSSYGLEHLLARSPSLQWVAINGTPAASSPRTATLPRRPGVEFFVH